MTLRRTGRVSLYDRIDADRPRIVALTASFFIVVTLAIFVIIAGPPALLGQPGDYLPYLATGVAYATASVCAAVACFAFFGIRAPRLGAVRTNSTPASRLSLLIMSVVLVLGAVLPSIAPLALLAVFRTVERVERGESPLFFGRYEMLIVLPVAAVLCGLWLAAARTLDAEWAIRRLGARAADARSSVRTAVYGISLAAGLPAPPRVFVLETAAANAFMLRSSDRSVSIVFTAGMLGSFSAVELEAVSAVLIAQLLRGRTRSTQLFAVLAGPLGLLEWPWRTFQQTVRRLMKGDLVRAAAGVDEELAIWSILATAGPGQYLLLFAWLPAVLALWYSVTRSRDIAPCAADAEALLLCKNPGALASALAKAGAQGPVVPEVSVGFAPLFFVWPRHTAAGKRREWERLQALWQIAGPEAMVDAGVIALLEQPRPEISDDEELPHTSSEDERLYRHCLGEDVAVAPSAAESVMRSASDN